jgi:type I restriction enzyme R subunit
MMNEDQLEQLSLSCFQDTGCDYTNGADISPDGDDPEWDDHRVVVLKDRLLLAVVDLQNPADESAGVWKAYSQLQAYKDEISDLLAYNVALVISDGVTARVGSLKANKERFMPWNTIKNEDDGPLLEYQLEKVVRGFFDRELFLDDMWYFVLFEEGGDSLIKKDRRLASVPRSPRSCPRHDDRGCRFRRWRRSRTTSHLRDEVQPGSRKAGVFWHTQGSGKSISMCCYVAGCCSNRR